MATLAVQRVTSKMAFDRATLEAACSGWGQTFYLEMTVVYHCAKQHKFLIRRLLWGPESMWSAVDRIVAQLNVRGEESEESNI